MEDPDSNQLRIKTVTDHVSVDLLMNLRSARNLSPFLRSEHRLGEAAAVLGIAPSSLAYWVSRFHKAGLIEVVRLEPRAGKPIPVYRAVADEFRIPVAAMPPGARNEFLHSGRRRLFDEFVQAIDKAADSYFAAGLKVSPHATRGVAIGFVEPPGSDESPISEFWGVIDLTRAEAAEFAHEIETLVAKYASTANDGAAGPKRRSYVTVLGLAPQASPR